MALFIANQALSKSLIDSAKLGIFLTSVFCAMAGLALLRWLPAREKGPPCGEATEV
jgi:NhaA family Na+:H+ antiporter